MRRRNKVVIGLLACATAGIAAYYYFIHDPDAPRSDWPVLQAAKSSRKEVDVAIGPNVQVTSTDNAITYWECVIAADANDPARLVSAVILRKPQPETDIVGYYSHDGGATWQQGCKQVCPKGHQFFDPTVAFGPDGTAYLAYMDTDPGASTDEKDVASLVFLASSDGGQSWDKRAVYPEFVDRPWLVVDDSSGENRGRVYCFGQVERRAIDGQKSHAEPIFFHSNDKLKALSAPVFPHAGRQMINCRPANPIVFADGTLLIAYQDRYLKRYNPTWPRPVIYTMRSNDGGQTYETSTPVDTKWWHETIVSSANSVVGAEFPQLAVDASSKTSMDRLYCVWTDGRGHHHNGTRIFFSSSSDHGETWSPAVVLSEQSMEVGVKEEYASFVPSIAVNKDGVIAVSWYDRRGLPKTKRVPVDEVNRPGVSNMISEGWNFRIRVSLDGGTTWLPSTQVNEQPGRGGVFVGHTAGLVAGADGRFHAAWIDNRIGKNKLWTTSIEVGTE